MLASCASEHLAGGPWGAYTVDEAALRHRAGVEQETSDAELAYARFPKVEQTRYRDGWLSGGLTVTTSERGADTFCGLENWRELDEQRLGVALQGDGFAAPAKPDRGPSQARAWPRCRSPGVATLAT